MNRITKRISSLKGVNVTLAQGLSDADESEKYIWRSCIHENLGRILELEPIVEKLSELEEMAVELLEFGDSKEKAEGRGMMRVIKELL